MIGDGWVLDACASFAAGGLALVAFLFWPRAIPPFSIPPPPWRWTCAHCGTRHRRPPTARTCVACSAPRP